MARRVVKSLDSPLEGSWTDLGLQLPGLQPWQVVPAPNLELAMPLETTVTGETRGTLPTSRGMRTRASSPRQRLLLSEGCRQVKVARRDFTAANIGRICTVGEIRSFPEHPFCCSYAVQRAGSDKRKTCTGMSTWHTLFGMQALPGSSQGWDRAADRA